MNKQEFIEKFEVFKANISIKNHGYKEDDELLTLWKDTLDIWANWVNEIKNGLSIDRWIKQGYDASPDSYLPGFLEHKEKLFGSAKPAGSNLSNMIVFFENKTNSLKREKYKGKIHNRYKGKEAYFEKDGPNKKEDYEDDYVNNIQKLLKKLVEVNNINDLIEIGSSPEYDGYFAKQILQKISVLMSLMDNSPYKYQLLPIYTGEKIDKLLDIFEIRKNKKDNCLKKNYEIMKKALEWSELKYDDYKSKKGASFDEDEYRKEYYKLYMYIWNEYCLEEYTKNENEIIELFKNGYRQIVLTGAPGTGKTYSAKKIAQSDENAVTIKDLTGNEEAEELKYQFVQFHPSYDYTDFVEGLRPIQLEKGKDPTFVRVDGIFKEFCRRAALDQNEDAKYYFIIDEINRADLSKVFGELMYSLEYRGPEGKIQTQYSNLKTYVRNYNIKDKENDPLYIELDDDIFEDGFYIPKNVYIIGTMNDIDRSVESFDFALRRRFKWIEVKAKDVMETILKEILNNQNENNVKALVKRVNDLNNFISKDEFGMGLSDSYHIGPAYFKLFSEIVDNSQFETKIKKIFESEIKATLKEYVRGRDPENIKKFLDKCSNVFGIKNEKVENDNSVEENVE